MNNKTHTDRFWQKVNKTGKCWEWTGCLKDGSGGCGYGFFWFNGKNVRAHRFSWILSFGEIPNELCVCHKCDNPRCVNPEHLFLGTVHDNNVDAVKKGRVPNKHMSTFMNLVK